MKKVAKLLAVIFLSCTIFTIVGCAKKTNLPENAISLSLAINRDGVFRQDLEVSMQSQKLKDIGVSQTLISEVKNNMINALTNLRNEFYLSFLVAYSTSPNPDYKMGEALLVSDCIYNEKYDIVYFSIIFKDMNAWKYYHGQETSGEEMKKANSALQFFEKTNSSGLFPFAGEYVQSNGEKTTIGQRYLKIYQAAFNVTLPNSICQQLEVPNFVYDYATPFASIRSNADLAIQSGNLYHNIWIRDLDNFKDCTLNLSITKIYYSHWYLAIMILAIFVLAIGLLIIKLKARRGIKIRPKGKK